MRLGCTLCELSSDMPDQFMKPTTCWFQLHCSPGRALNRLIVLLEFHVFQFLIRCNSVQYFTLCNFEEDLLQRSDRKAVGT